MRVLILHGDSPKILKSVEALKKGLEQEGAKVDLLSPANSGSSPVTTAPYSLVCVASGFTGWWKPQIPTEIDNLLKRATRLEGKKGGAFVQSKFLGSSKALRVLMAHMERQGVIVEDFGTLGGEQEMASVAKRLNRLA